VNLDTQVANYNIGYSVKGERAFCQVERYPQANCAGTASNIAQPAWDPGNVWEDWSLSMGRLNFRSVRVACWLEPSNAGEFWLDKVYVSPAPARF
jgi:hypothetical protein